MRIDQGDTIFAEDGTRLGDVRRVVVDPSTLDVTHVVVGGRPFRQERVVPAERLEERDANTLVLPGSIGPDDLPVFEERHVVPINPGGDWADDELLAWYSPQGVRGAYPTFLDFGPAPREVTTRNLPQEVTALRVGAEVVSADDQPVGEVEEVITGSSGQVESFVVASGLVFEHRTMIPVGWVQNWGEEQVRLSVRSHVLQNLPAYQS